MVDETVDGKRVATIFGMAYSICRHRNRGGQLSQNHQQLCRAFVAQAYVDYYKYIQLGRYGGKKMDALPLDTLCQLRSHSRVHLHCSDMF
jgi:hypothetical protein